MKTLQELSNEIKKQSDKMKKLKDLENKLDKENRAHYAAENKTLFAEWYKSEERQKELNAIAKNYNDIESAETVLKFMENNYKHALAAEYMPIIKSVLQKYNGKRYGEATADKIKNEIKTAANGKIAAYIYRHSYDRTANEINIIELDKNGFNAINGYSVDIWTSNDILNADNIIYASALDDCRPIGLRPYIEGYFAALREMDKLKKAYEKAEEAKRAAAQSFNNLFAVEGVDILKY